MIDGMDNDDRYRMVEDELLAVARTFTAHLHAAAYQRLRAKAKSQTAAALRSLARPTTITGASSSTIDRVARRTAATKQKEKQAAALRALKGKGKEKVDDESDKDDGEEETPWAGTALQDLMETDPRKARPSLVSLSSVVGNRSGGQRPTSTLTATKSTRQPIVADSDDEDDDDLDGPPVERKPPPPVIKSSPPMPKPSIAATHRMPTGRDSKSVSFAPTTRKVEQKIYMEEDPEGDDDDDDLDDDAGDLLLKLRKRRAQEKADRLQEQKRRRQQKKEQDEKAALDTIPSFL